MSFAIITDSASNLTKELIDEYQIDMISFNYILNNEAHPCFNQNRPYQEQAKEFYSWMREGKLITTSLVAPQAFYDAFKKHIEKGEEILCITISSGLSGTYNSALNARDLILEEFPQAKILILDSLGASFGQGMQVMDASNLRKEGKSIDEVYKILSDKVLTVNYNFIVDDLIYLKRSGRISKLVYSLGSFLDLKPLLHASKEGKVEAYGKVRGRKKALLTIVETIKERIIDAQNQILYLVHCDVEEEAKKLAQIIKDTIKVKDVYVNYCDLCAGAHGGPGTIAAFYYGKAR